jgi:hypothetical protein
VLLALAFDAGLDEVAQGVEDTGVGTGLGRDLIFEDNFFDWSRGGSGVKANKGRFCGRFHK